MYAVETVRPVMKESTVTLHSTTPKQPAEAPQLPAEESVRIIKDYVRPVGQQETTMVKCEICGRSFAKHAINEHIQLELQDPRYVEIRNEVIEKSKNTTMASGDLIAQHLSQLKRKRPDIFNAGDEQVRDEPRKQACTLP